MWRRRIDRAAVALNFGPRGKSAQMAQVYLHGEKYTGRGKKVYLNYMLPILEERNRQTLPDMPHLDIDSHTEGGDALADRLRSLSNLLLTGDNIPERKRFDELMWDDAFWGCGIGKVSWLRQESLGDDIIPDDEQLQKIALDKALEENADPMNIRVLRSDIHSIHLNAHQPLLRTMTENDSRWPTLSINVRDHIANMSVVRSERPLLERVAPDRYVYDPYMPWEDRAWEAEKKSYRVRQLMFLKYKNVNVENAPPEDKGMEESLPYEDKTVLVWEIHDRMDGMMYTIPAKGPEKALFLNKREWDHGSIDIYRPLVLRPTVNDKGYGVATAGEMESILIELAMIDFRIRRHVEAHSSYTMMGVRGTMSPEEKHALKDPDQMFVEMGAEAMAGMKEYKPPSIPSTLLEQRQNLLNELRRVAGTEAQDVGVSNPHVVSATESGRRAGQSDERRGRRGKRMASYLSWVMTTYLAMYKVHGNKRIEVKTVGREGVQYDSINPSVIPSDVKMLVDIEGVTLSGRQAAFTNFMTYTNLVLSLPIPVDHARLADDGGRLLGIAYPEKYRLNDPESPAEQLAPPETGGIPGQQSAGVPRTQTGGKTIQFPETQTA